MSKYLTDLRLGELLVKTGLVSVKQVSDVVKIAGNQNLQFGQMLVKSGWLKNSELSAGLAAQSAIRDRIVDKTEASRALITACKKGITFDQALRLSGNHPEIVMPTNKLGELMVESGIITDSVCFAAVAKSILTGLPLGRILVSAGSISEGVLMNVLEFQLRVRDGLLSREEAVALLKSAPDSAASESETSGQHVVRLGELLVRARILERSDVTNVLEVGLQRGTRIGELLIRYGFVSEQLLEAALTLQQMVDNSFLQVEQASLCLKHIEQTGSTISDAIVELDMVNAPTSTASPDATFGSADEWPRAQAPKTRLRRLMRSLVSADEPRLSESIEGAYKNLASAYARLAKKHIQFDNHDEAEWLLERTVSLKLQMYGPFDQRLVPELLRLTELLLKQKKYHQAQRSALRAMELLENSKPYNAILLAEVLNLLGCIYYEQGFYGDAEPFLSRSLTLREIHLPTIDLRLADSLRDYARLLAATDRQVEASKMHFHAHKIVMRNRNAPVEPPSFFEQLYLHMVPA